MIDFIISKLGILMFAVTMAGLLLYFSGSVKDVFLSDETIQVSNIVAKQIKYMAESDNLCASTKVILPKYIDIFGLSENASFTAIYYIMDINVVSSGLEDNFVIFSLSNKQTKKLIALESFRTKSQVILLDSYNQQTDGISIDPTQNNVVYMVKNRAFENNEEKTDLFFVSCKYDQSALGNCSSASEECSGPFNDCYKKLAELNKSYNLSGTKYPFFCVPFPTSTPGGP